MKIRHLWTPWNQRSKRPLIGQGARIPTDVDVSGGGLNTRTITCFCLLFTPASILRYDYRFEGERQSAQSVVL